MPLSPENILCDEVGRLQHASKHQTDGRRSICYVKQRRSERRWIIYCHSFYLLPAHFDCFNNFFLSMSYDYKANNTKLVAFGLSVSSERIYVSISDPFSVRFSTREFSGGLLWNSRLMKVNKSTQNSKSHKSASNA